MIQLLRHSCQKNIRRMNLTKIVVYTGIWAILVFGSGLRAACQSVISSFDDFAAIDSLSLEIETDAKKLSKLRDNKQWFPATMRVFSGNRLICTQTAEVKSRGKTRLEICGFPPLRLRPVSAGATALKIVSDCNKTDDGESVVLREHLMYTLYQTLTPESFRTVLFDVIVKQHGSNKPFFRSSAILIEDDETLARRLGGKEFSPSVMSPSGIDSVCLDRLCMFQFMIGNTDWSIYNRHNIKLIKKELERKVIAIPYDFDYAGAVGAAYAVPAPGLPIQSVKERYYLGLCRPEADVQRMVAFFQAHRQEIISACEHYRALPAGACQQTARYIAVFFELLDDPKAVHAQITAHCNNFKKR